jgi:hypothetical protein
VAKTEQINSEDKLGLVDRVCRTLRGIIEERYYEIKGNRTDNLKHVVQSAMDTYNDNDYRTIKRKPNKVWTENNPQLSHHSKDMIHNGQVYKQCPLNLVKIYAY